MSIYTGYNVREFLVKKRADSIASGTPTSPYDQPFADSSQPPASGKDPATDSYYKGWYDAQQKGFNNNAATNINTSGSLGFGDAFLPILLLMMLPNLMGKSDGKSEDSKE